MTDFVLDCAIAVLLAYVLASGIATYVAVQRWADDVPAPTVRSQHAER